MNEPNEIAEEIRNSDSWDYEKCRELCELAGILDEWEKADGEEFENVVNKAAEILGVDIF